MLLKNLNSVLRQKLFHLNKRNRPLLSNTIRLISEKDNLEGQNTNSSFRETIEETIDISKNESQEGISIGDLYSINNRKMGPKDPTKFIDISRFQHKNVKLRIFSDESFAKCSPNTLTPVSPRLGPYEVINPKLEGKTYHWCACGMSNKQPFCDGSHRNGEIRPISFKLGEKVESMLLCGCKLSTVKPFCDRKTCVKLHKKEDEEIANIVSEHK